MREDKNSFVVYAEIKETIDELTDEEVGKLFRGMVEYQATGEIPELTGILKFAFIPVRQQMDRNNSKWQRTRERRAEAGRRGGVKSGESRRNEANEANASNEKHDEANEVNASGFGSNEANEAVNVNDNVNVNVNGNVNVNVPVNVPVNVSDEVPDAEALSLSLIKTLNAESGSRYKLTAEFTGRIRELLNAGYTEADMMKVIKVKAAEWRDDAKMKQYLRPRTLFGDKFEDYVLAPVPVAIEEKENRSAEIASLTEEKRRLETDVEVLATQIGIVRNSVVAGSGGCDIEALKRDLEALKIEKATKEQRIEFIEKRMERLKE